MTPQTPQTSQTTHITNTDRAHTIRATRRGTALSPPDLLRLTGLRAAAAAALGLLAACRSTPSPAARQAPASP